jgi:TonB family protein
MGKSKASNHEQITRRHFLTCAAALVGVASLVEPSARNQQQLTARSGGGGGNKSATATVQTRKAKIKSKPNAEYTREARENRVEGTVVLRAVLSSAGEVTNIAVVRGLPHGLSGKAVEAARKIEFEPALKDGRAVSQYVTIEYNFVLDR